MACRPWRYSGWLAVLFLHVLTKIKNLPPKNFLSRDFPDSTHFISRHWLLCCWYRYLRSKHSASRKCSATTTRTTSCLIYFLSRRGGFKKGYRLTVQFGRYRLKLRSISFISCRFRYCENFRSLVRFHWSLDFKRWWPPACRADFGLADIIFISACCCSHFWCEPTAAARLPASA